MVLLIHHPVSPFSRKVRIVMGEKDALCSQRGRTMAFISGCFKA